MPFLSWHKNDRKVTLKRFKSFALVYEVLDDEIRVKAVQIFVVNPTTVDTLSMAFLLSLAALQANAPPFIMSMQVAFACTLTTQCHMDGRHNFP